jgi:hypothetical protein
MSKYQFIVISVSEERKRNLETQFAELGINTPLLFLPTPSLISNSQSYLPSHVQDTNKQKIICCSRDHLRAIALACNDTSPEFSVIFEDDIALHKTQFIHGIEEIMANWDTWIAPDKMASVGWIPCNNYATYIPASSKHTMKCVLGSKILHDRFAPGTQAYIVRKKDVAPLVPHLIHPTFDEFFSHIHGMNFPDLPKTNGLIAIDMYINRILGQAILFPPLVIEQDTPSLIGHTNVTLFWDVFFKDYEAIKKNYYSF